MGYENKRILLVEDNELNRMMATIALSDYEMEIDEAEHGEQALQMVEQSEEGYYSMILMDIMMPVMDGVTATKNIRALGRTDCSEVPIIAMTAESDSDEIAKYTESGFDDYISKPMEMEDIEAIFERFFG